MTEEKKHEYGKERRLISWEDRDGNLARLIIKLRHESLSRAEFYRAITLGFIEDNAFLDNFILDYKKKKEFFRKGRQKILNKEREMSSETTKRFGLDPDEIEDLFDLFEEEQGL